MSTDESEREDEDGDDNEGGQPSGSVRKVQTEPPQIERWESGAPSGRPKASSALGRSQEVASAENADASKRGGQPDVEGDVSTRKRKSDGAAERIPKGQSKAKTRNTRSADWLPGGSPRGAGPGGERGASTSSSSEDESAAPTESQAADAERSRPKTKGPSSKKYNGMREKTARQGGFWEIPEKRAKVSGNAEERVLVRPKGQKDVWSSIQAQWPKKTLKDLFSDSDTEATNSPPPPAPSRLDEPGGAEDDAGPEDEASEEQLEKLQELPSSGSNSVLNTPPTTPESPSGGGSAVEDSGPAQPSPPPPSPPPALPSEPVSDALPPDPTQEEVAGGRSETDSSTVEVESLGGELQELPQDNVGGGSPSKAFDGSPSCNSSSSCSLELSGSSQPDSEQKSKGANISTSVQ